MWMGNVSSKAVKPNKKRHTKTLNHENIDVNRRETLERIENLKSLFSEDNVTVDSIGEVSSHVVTEGSCGRVNRTTDLIVDTSREVNSSALTGGTNLIVDSSREVNSSALTGGGRVNRTTNLIVDSSREVNSSALTGGGRVNRTTDLIVDTSREVNSSALTGGGRVNRTTNLINDSSRAVNSSALTGGGRVNRTTNLIVDSSREVNSSALTGGGRVNRTTDLIVDTSREVNSSALPGGNYPTLTIVTREPRERFNGTTNCVGPGDCVSGISNGISGSLHNAVSGKILSSDTSRISSHNGGPETSLQNGVSIGINEQQEIRNAHFDKIREPRGLPSASSRIPTRVTTLTNNDIVEYNNVYPVQSSSLSGSGSPSSSFGSLGSTSDKLNFKRKCIRDGRVIEEECMDTDNTLNVCESRKHNEFTSVTKPDPPLSRPSPDFKVEELSLPKPFSSSSSTSVTVSFPTSEISSSTAAMGPSTAAMGPSTAASNYPLNFLTTDDQDRYSEMGDQYTEIQYDAYINCTDNHISLAKIFIKNLQNPPYNFKLFLPQKQLLLGSWDMDVKREIVETRCSGKVIALLGRDHGDSDSCHFINYFAKTLDPTAKLSKLIPVIVEEMETFPKITDGMHRIFYQRDNGRGFLWDKLNSALMFRGSDASE